MSLCTVGSDQVRPIKRFASKNRVLRVRRQLVLGGITNQTFSFWGEGHVRRCDSVSLVIGNNFYSSILENTDTANDKHNSSRTIQIGQSLSVDLHPMLLVNLHPLFQSIAFKLSCEMWNLTMNTWFPNRYRQQFQSSPCHHLQLGYYIRVAPLLPMTVTVSLFWKMTRMKLDLLGLHMSKKRVGVADRCEFILPLVHILFPNNLLLMIHIKFD